MNPASVIFKNPLDDIRNTKTIAGVVRNGDGMTGGTLSETPEEAKMKE